MTISKPKFWDKKIGYLSYLLFPFSLTYIFLNFLKKKLTIANRFKIPIICIGNIYVGGTGKTPTSILLANELTKIGRQTVILKKFYKSHADEYKLINNNFKNLITSNNRVDGLKEAEKSKFDVVILDDGLQDYSIGKDLNIICFNQNQLIGNGLVMPSGPLRENLSALKKAQIIIINGYKDKNFEKKILDINNKLEIFYSSYKPMNLEEFKNRKLLAIAGIGNPENFFKLIEENNLKIEKRLVFPDHHIFSEKEIRNIINNAEENNYQIIMTEKDYYKINHYNFKMIKYLRVSLDIVEKEKLLNRVNTFI